MKRRAAPNEAAKFSLFPFLAVLLCVMGALIVLLIVIAQRTHDLAKERSQDSETDKARQIEREDLAWRIEQVLQSRDQTAAQLAEQRAGLAHIEDHARRLREKYRQLEQAAQDLEKSMASPTAQALDAELAAIQARIQKTGQLLDEKRRAPQAPGGYAIIPYEGPNGTQRRPMYIECTDAGIILQPEGVVLTADDFLGPLGPGNPLAASMRAAREHLLRNRNTDAREAGEPYPLLLIRPDGIGAYYVARASLTSWGSEFGYEFVDQDWKLEYPPVDPELLAITKAAAEDARQRQRMLARAAPKIYEAAEEGGTYFRASPSTGGVMVDGRSSPRASAGRRAAARGTSVSGRNGRGTTEDESPLADHDGPLGSGGFARSGSAAKSGRQGRAGPAAAASEKSADHEAAGAPEVRLTSRGANSDASGQPGEPLRPGQYVPKPKSMASQRGKDWGLRDAGPSAVPISRKIRIRCQTNQLAIISDDRGVKNEQVVALGERTEDSVEELVARVWDHMDRWGIAGANMYWKPQLLFETKPESRPRYEEIKALLEGSGLDVAEKAQANTAHGKSKPPR